MCVAFKMSRGSWATVWVNITHSMNVAEFILLLNSVSTKKDFGSRDEKLNIARFRNTFPWTKRKILERACYMLQSAESFVMSNLNMTNNNWINHSSMIRFSSKLNPIKSPSRGFFWVFCEPNKEFNFIAEKTEFIFSTMIFFWNCRKLFRCGVKLLRNSLDHRLASPNRSIFNKERRNKNKKSWIASRWCSKLAPEHLIYWHSTDQRIFKSFDQRLKGIKVDCRPCARLVPFLKSNISVKWLCSFFPFIQQGAKKSHYYDGPNAYLNEELVIF